MTFSKMISSKFGLKCSYSSGQGERWFYVGDLKRHSDQAEEIIDWLKTQSNISTYRLTNEKKSTAYLLIEKNTTRSCVINDYDGLFMIYVNNKFDEKNLIEHFKTIGSVVKV